MKFSGLALLAIAASVTAREEVSFEMDLLSKKLGDQTVILALNEKTKCSVEYETLPFDVDCYLGVSVLAVGSDGVRDEILDVGVQGGASFYVEGESDLKMSGRWGVDVPIPEVTFSTFNVGLKIDQMKHFPSEGGSYVVDIPDAIDTRICISDISKLLSGSAASTFEKAFDYSGSEVCLSISNVKKDGTSGASFSIIADVDFLNEELINIPVITSSDFAKFRDALDIPEVNLSIDIGKEIVKYLNSQTVSDSRLRRLAASEGTAYVNSEGEFTMGSMSSSSGSGSNVLLLGAVAGVGILLVAAGGFIVIKRTRTSAV